MEPDTEGKSSFYITLFNILDMIILSYPISLQKWIHILIELGNIDLLKQKQKL